MQMEEKKAWAQPIIVGGDGAPNALIYGRCFRICGATYTDSYGRVAGPCGYLWTGCMAPSSAVSGPLETS
jgi:hypothetical protein